MVRMTGGFGRRKSLALQTLAAAAVAGLISANDALAQNADCAQLQAAIAAAPRGGGAGGGQYAAAAERQRAELAHTSAYAHSIGCDNQKFLFFGSEPPPQCGEIKGQIARMQASLADLQARSGGGGGRANLIARYNAECLNAPKPPANIFEALFGGGARLLQSANPDALPPDQQELMIEKSIETEKKEAHVSAGSYAVCVRTCDGSFFPVSYSGASRADSLEEVCRSLCPNTDVALYSFPFGETVNEAVSPTGERYIDLPNALKFQQAYDSSCSCRRKGESWAEALAAAEARYGHEPHDILVTPEKSLELSRPIIAKAAADAKTKPTKSNAATAVAATPAGAPSPGASPTTAASPTAAAPSLDASSAALDVNGAETALSAAAANVSREASGIAGGDAQSGTSYKVGQGDTVTETGPDGVRRKVRIVGPAL
jgi:hypothetical protein